jgi:hypothetical protein
MRRRAAVLWTMLVTAGGPGCGVSPPEPFWEGEHLAYGKTADVEVCRGSWVVQDGFVAELAGLINVDLAAPIPFTLIEPDELEHYCEQPDVLGCARNGSAAYSIYTMHLHELTHVVTRQGGFRGPLAFNEGLAEVFGDGVHNVPERLPVEDAVYDFEAGGGASYTTAALFVRFLIEEQGLEALLEFLALTDEHDDADEYGRVFREVFGVELEDMFVAFDEYPTCSMMNNRIALTECGGTAVAWKNGIWQADSALDCDDPTVFGPVDSGGERFLGTNRSLVVERGGTYRIDVSGSADGLAGVRINRCGSCWDAFEVRVRVGESGALDLAAGRYYVTLIREVERAGDVRVTLAEPP